MKNIFLVTTLFISTISSSLVQTKGRLTVICGSMCSGKSTELIRQISRFVFANKKVLVLKSSLDTRILHQKQSDAYSQISARNGTVAECVAIGCVEHLIEILSTRNPDIIIIDEAQFLLTEQEEFIATIQQFVKNGKIVIVAGLDVDFKGDPFGPMPTLMAIADEVVKLTAICAICGNDSYCITQRLIDGKPASRKDPLIVIGTTNYEPRCRSCHELPE